MIGTHASRRKLGFIRQDLADLPDSFPACVIREGKIARADGLPLEWEQYDLLGESFPATLTEDGELQISLRPTPAHADKAGNLVNLLDHYLSCHRAGETCWGPELRIRPYRRTLAPDVMFFKNSKPEWKQESATHIDQIPDLAVEIVSPSNVGKKWEDNLAFYHQAGFPEFWLVQLDGAVEIWRGSQPNLHPTCGPGELFSSPLFPGLALDPAWIKNYPEEIKLIEQFRPEILVLQSRRDPNLTKKASALAGRIAEHFGQASRSAQLESEIIREARRQPRISQEPRAGGQHEPGREHER